MKRWWWIACLGISLLAGCSNHENAVELKDSLRFVDEPQPVLKEAFSLWWQYYGETDPLGEKYYVGYTDDTGLVRKLLYRDSYYKDKKTFEEEILLKKTTQGYYCETHSLIWGNVYSLDKYHYRLGKRGIAITTQRKFLSEDAIALNGEQKTTTRNISYLHDDGYLWQSDCKKAKIQDNRYFEHYYVKKKDMWDNIIYNDQIISEYYEDDRETNKPLIKYKYVFSYTKDPRTGEIHGKLVDWLWNMRALFDGPEQWIGKPMKIELHVKTNLHAQDMKVNILNQYIIPHSEYLIPFIYGLKVDYQEN